MARVRRGKCKTENTMAKAFKSIKMDMSMPENGKWVISTTKAN